MQSINLDHIDRRILEILQSEPGVNATAIGERIGLSQSACWRRIQSLRDQGVIKEQTVRLDREKVGLNTMVFAHVKLTSHGRGNLTDFADAVRHFPEVLDCYVVLGNFDYLLRIVEWTALRSQLVSLTEALLEAAAMERWRQGAYIRAHMSRMFWATTVSATWDGSAMEDTFDISSLDMLLFNLAYSSKPSWMERLNASPSACGSSGV